MDPVWRCSWNQVCIWRRLDDSGWFLTDIKGTSSVLYDVNKKHQVSLIRKKDCGCYCVWIRLCLHMSYMSVSLRGYIWLDYKSKTFIETFILAFISIFYVALCLSVKNTPMVHIYTVISHVCVCMVDEIDTETPESPHQCIPIPLNGLKHEFNTVPRMLSNCVHNFQPACSMQNEIGCHVKYGNQQACFLFACLLLFLFFMCTSL